MECDKILAEVGGSAWIHKEDCKFLGGYKIILLEKIDEYGSITKAAVETGISYKTAWETIDLMNNLAGKPLVERMTGGKGGGGTTLTAEGKKLLQELKILREEHRNFLNSLSKKVGDAGHLYQFVRRISMKVSARNVFAGRVTEIRKGVVSAEVILALKGGIPLSAIVTNCSVDNLGLREGMDAYAIIKASSIMIGIDLHNAKFSARNIMCGTISKIIEGTVINEVVVELGAGNTVGAMISRACWKKLGLKEGDHACAIFKASSVILGVN